MILTWVEFVIEIFIVVHPDLHRTHGVVVQDMHYPTRPTIGRDFTENMANAGAGGYQDLATTHPDLEDRQNEKTNMPKNHHDINVSSRMKPVTVLANQCSVKHRHSSSHTASRQETTRSLSQRTFLNPSNAEATFVKFKDANVFENHSNPVILVFIG